MDLKTLALAGVLCLAFTTEATAGFGSMLVALSLGAHLFPIRELLPIVLPMNVLLAGFIVWRHGHHAQLRLLITRVAPFLAVGMVLGQLVFRRASPSGLKRGLGILIVLMALFELWRLFNKRPRVPLKPRLRAAVLLVGGVVHGMYATGGPFVVYVLTRSQLSKPQLRSTLTSLWVCINIVLTGVFIADGSLGSHNVGQVAIMVPSLVLGTYLGEKAHAAVNEETFRMIVLLLLSCAGISLLF